MTLFKTLSRFFLDAPARGVTYDWNGKTIRFSDWADDAYGIFEYQTRDRSFDFVFDLQPAGGHVRVYIVEQPDYDGRPDDGHSTHRLFDRAEDLHYVCIEGRMEPKTVPHALTWAIYWAEQTGEYIRTGRSFS